jgi:hypothetical protein
MVMRLSPGCSGTSASTQLAAGVMDPLPPVGRQVMAVMPALDEAGPPSEMLAARQLRRTRSDS